MNPTTISAKASNIEINAAKGDGAGLPKFTITAYTGGLMTPMGWEEPVGVEFSGIDLVQKVPVNGEHSRVMAVGHTEKVYIQDDTVKAEGVVSRENEYSRDIVASGKAGFPWQASIGLGNLKASYIKAGETAILNGKKQAGPFFHVTASKLDHIAFTEHGADSSTQAAIAAKQNPEPNTMSDQTTKPATPEVPPVVQATPAAPPAPPASEPLAVIAAARTEQIRKDSITATAEKYLANATSTAEIDKIEKLMVNAIENKRTSPQDFERDMIVCATPKTISLSGKDGEINASVLECATARASGLRDVEKTYNERTLEAANKHFRHGMGLRELIECCARQNGYGGRSSDLESVMASAFQPSAIRAAGFSTNVIGGILSNIANKFIREAFMYVESGWEQIAAIANVRDFKTRTVYSLTGNLDFERVSNGGEIAHGTLGEETYTNKAETYGKMLAITRQDLINDDLDALSAVPRRLGRSAAIKLNEVFWAEFLADHATFFNTDKSKKNYIDGAASVLSSAGLELANTAFYSQTDPNGKPLGSTPRKLVVPSALETTARELMNSQLIVSGSTGKNPNTNIWQNRFDVVHSSYLNASAIIWYLLADPQDLAMIEVAFLNGQRMPIVETAQADFNTLGIKMRGVYDFGVKKQEYRAAVKSKGAA